MGSVLLKMLPLALGTIAPTMIGLVVIFLTGTRGFVKSSAFILGKYLFYVIWGLISLELVDQLSSPGLKVSRSVSETFLLIVGLLLIILAVRNFFVEDDPDAPPPKFMTVLAKLGPVKLFGLGIGISIIQPRFIFFVLVGASIIAEARLSATENFISLLALALLMIWPMLIPLVVFLIMGEHRIDAMKSMRTWLVHNQRMINVGVMGIFGVLLLFLGLTGKY
ncbi:MAG TPA: GAP family protein [Ktedonobacteraceae bacterium]|nr:GAP family protein [Ktedonobacteraceae bacterium]